MENTIEKENVSLQEESVSPLEELVGTLEAQNLVKSDIVIPAGQVRYTDGILYIAGSEYTMTELCHEQAAEKLGIPIGYYRKLRGEYPSLLEQNINGWLSKKEQTKYLMRTFSYPETGVENVCRAMLSNRYNILDNCDVLLAALKAIKEMEGMCRRAIQPASTSRQLYSV